jgi:dipeptidyl-peptidase-3
VPAVSNEFLRSLAAKSPRLSQLFDQISPSINTIPPYSLGYPSETSQSAYYLGDGITEEDVQTVSKVLERNGIFPENTRIRKSENGSDFDVLLASVQHGGLDQTLLLPDGRGSARLLRGDHAVCLERVCVELSKAVEYAANDDQRRFVKKYIESFQTGSLEPYRDSLRIWVQDRAPRVENIFGFVEPYRDPHGIRSEFEGLVAISDDSETALLARLVENSAKFIRRLPWATPENEEGAL